MATNELVDSLVDWVAVTTDIYEPDKFWIHCQRVGRMGKECPVPELDKKFPIAYKTIFEQQLIQRGFAVSLDRGNVTIYRFNGEIDGPQT